MRAVRLYEYGGPEKMTLEELPTPSPGPGQIRIAIEAAGVNFNDIYQRSGQFRPVPLPVGVGQEGAGVVEAVGPGVRDFTVGDRVGWMGDHHGGCGSYATHAVLDVAVHWPVPLPASIGFRQAAACINQGVTGHALTHDAYPIRSGDVALVHAVAGGSGMLLGQMARMHGAWVIGTVSTEAKKAVALEFGAADEVIPYEDFDLRVRALTGGRGVDVAYDHIGVATFERTLSCLARRGTLVYYGMTHRRVPPFDLNRLGRMGSQFVTRPTVFDYIETREQLLRRVTTVFGWVAGGVLRLKTDCTYPLERAADAQAALAGRKTTGKVLILPN
jgi:NADPH2:quinone reductase